ncbi:hypothetical protein IWQ62_001781 [Dispira parvispora]|uniref:Uncharacterized protein n=1 Tax=Dispira parvispora TaxID=1520584 RepID=A0A9W8ASS5_9FUNG|nr:hypothetical protein IWQ62_001781 [Dispira parvispora]
MLISTLVLAALTAFCALTPVDSVPSLPVNLVRRGDQGGDSKDWHYYIIVKDKKELEHLPQDVVLHAFCSITGRSSCMKYRKKAYTQFWDVMKNGKASDDEKKGIDFLVENGDELYVRLLFADGTVFCKKNDGSYTEPFKEFIVSNERKNAEIGWVKALSDNKDYFLTILKKYYNRYMAFQEVKGLDKVESSVAKQGCTTYYDVSMRDGLDAMIKWAIVTGSNESIEPVIKTLVPDGKFTNFMWGSLYDTILVGNFDIMMIARAWVDCSKVEKDYQVMCNEIIKASQDGNVEGIPLNSDVLDKRHMSTWARDDKDNVIEDIKNYNRHDITLSLLLEG